VSTHFQRTGIAGRVRRFAAIATPDNIHVGCALSHRAIVAEAQRLGLKNVLVFEDDVMLTADALPRLATALRELGGRDWDLLYLGACRWERTFPLVDGCTSLAHAGPVTCTHAIAYRDTCFRRILEDAPADVTSMRQWLEIHCGIDQYYASSICEKKFLLSPVIATQPAILSLEGDGVISRLAT
jgi:GR25 family glycosyltransferase involved in LPS biosynthesis